MVITKSEFEEYIKAQNHRFPKNGSGCSPKPLSIIRQQLTNLEPEKYIYIYDHYNELKRRFEHA